MGCRVKTSVPPPIIAAAGFQRGSGVTLPVLVIAFLLVSHRDEDQRDIPPPCAHSSSKRLDNTVSSDRDPLVL